MAAINKPPNQDCYFARGAAAPLVFRIPDGAGSYVALDNTVSCQFTAGGIVLFTLTYGSGISLGSSFGGIVSPANSVCSILPNDIQSQAAPKDGTAVYECWQTVAGKRVFLLGGKALFEGGNNGGNVG